MVGRELVGGGVNWWVVSCVCNSNSLTDYDVFFFFNDTATTEIYTLSLHDALPIWSITHR